MLTRPLQDIENWLLFFKGVDLPVMRNTVRQIETMRADSDNINGRSLASVVLRDPLMTLKVLTFTQPLTGKSLRSDITTIGNAITLAGIEPFFRKFTNMPTVEQMLNDNPQHLLAALKLIRRVQRAARYAYEWALWRHDINVEEITIAALLHDLAEILLACFAPSLASEIRARQQSNPSLRSTAIQREVLGITLIDLQLALCRTWHLPEILTSLIDPEEPEHPRIHNVLLAVDLARHSANGWNDAALPDDFTAIGRLLNLNPAALIERLHLSDEEKAALPAIIKERAAAQADDDLLAEPTTPPTPPTSPAA